MSEYFDHIMEGLNEVLADTEEKKLKRHHVTYVPVTAYTKEQVKQIRRSTGMSQRNFARYMGISPKTVEAWESGKNTPSGAASRILDMIASDDKFIEKYPFVKMV